MTESVVLFSPAFVVIISAFALMLVPIGRWWTEAAFDRFWDMERLAPLETQSRLDPRFELPEDLMIEAEDTEIEVVEAVSFDGAVWCLMCLPDHASLLDEDVMPISSGDEWGASYPICLACGHEHRHVRLMGMTEN